MCSDRFLSTLKVEMTKEINDHAMIAETLDRVEKLVDFCSGCGRHGRGVQGSSYTILARIV